MGINLSLNINNYIFKKFVMIYHNMYTLLMIIILALLILITNKFEKFINFNQLKFDKKIGNINPFQIRSSNLSGENPLSMNYLSGIIKKKKDRIFT